MQHQPTSKIETGSRIVVVSNLVNKDTGEINHDVREALIRREALATFASDAPRYLREAAKLIDCYVADQQTAWRTAHGLPVAMTEVHPFPGGFGSVF